ncbi:T9SS type A sorting domain-containing protein, partial [bacterium]|nr:T9SS type A sorting domain-containing protein [bacterium]
EFIPTDTSLEFSIVITDELVSIQDNEFEPKYISMINYPNPFYLNGASRNSSTTIKYRIPQKGITELKIYNIKGQKVKTLMNQVQEIGVYEISWFGKDEFGKNVGSGVYFYKLEVDNKKALVKKMLLLR